MILFEKKYQTFDTVFHHQMKHLEVRQKYSAARRIFNSLLGVSSGDETLHLMFDILLLQYMYSLSMLRFQQQRPHPARTEGDRGWSHVVYIPILHCTGQALTLCKFVGRESRVGAHQHKYNQAEKL